MAQVEVVEGDLLAQPVEVIVNAWNRNIIPWWLLLPQGVSGAIKRRGGRAPFWEIGRTGPLPLGHARWTGAGRLPFAGIIHVASIDMLWRASVESVRDGTTSALSLVHARQVRAIALPILGAGSGGFDEDAALSIMRAAADAHPFPGLVRIVRFRPDLTTEA